MSIKKFLNYSLFLVLLLQTNKIFSQCPNPSTVATTPDLIALPTGSTVSSPPCPSIPYVTTTANTGTDAYYDGNNVCQVMVWDGTRASFSWNYLGFTGNIQFSSFMSSVALIDPDVVVQAGPSGGVYATMVAEVSSGVNSGKIIWAVFKWGGSSFGTAPTSTGYLGDVTNNGVCKNPNIDANSCGRVAICWAQRINYNVTLTSSGMPAGLNFGPVVIPMARGDIFIAQGYVDGTSCNGAGVISGRTVASGDRASVPASPRTIDHLFEVNINPDICISEAAGGVCGSSDVYVLTITYINQWFDPANFVIKCQVVAAQHKTSGGCVTIPNTSDYVELDCNNYPGRPRIAARPDNTNTNRGDYQIVMADPSSYCFAGGPPCNPWNTKIYNWGKNNGVNPSSTPSVLSTTPINLCDLTTVYNNEAVVSYRSVISGAPADEYVVAWTNAGNVTSGSGKDVVARTYNQGATNLTPTGITTLSIVNDGCATAGLNGDQYLPSIAARYIKPVAYQYFNQGTPTQAYIGYKTSAGRPGSATALRQVVNANGLSEQAEGSESFTVQPNPFINEISFRINLKAENKASQIEITDASGRLVQTLKVPDNASIVTWKPGTSASAGIYHAKLYTSQGPLVTQIIKTN